MKQSLKYIIFSLLLGLTLAACQSNREPNTPNVPPQPDTPSTPTPPKNPDKPEPDKPEPDKPNEPNTQELSIDLAKKSIELTLVEGKKQTSFNIVKGSGSYTLEAKPADLVKLSLTDNNKRVEVVAQKPGEADIVLTDTQWKQQITVHVTIAEPAPLALSADELLFDLDKDTLQKEIEIVSGNGDYSISIEEAAKDRLDVKVTDNRKRIVVKLLDTNKLATKVTVKDNDSQQTQRFSVKVLPKSVQHQSAFSLIIPSEKWDKYTKEERYNTISKYITKGEEWYEHTEMQPALPQSPRYQQQSTNYEYGKDLFRRKVAYYREKREILSGPDLWELYIDIYQYGSGWACIEWLARMAEQFHTKYPDNNEIDQLITATFDGQYTTQEGNDFFIGMNRDLIGSYNKIVDIFNKLERDL